MQGGVENEDWQKSDVSSPQLRKAYIYGIEGSETDSSLAVHALACTLQEICTGVVALNFADCPYEAT